MIKTQHTIDRAENVIKNAEQLLSDPEKKEHLCLTFWVDLLGFSKHLNFSDNQKISEEIGMKRIAVFHEISIQSMCDNHDIIQLNDATVFCHTIKKDENTIDSLSEFFARVNTFWEIATIADKKIGGFGARGVVSIGLRHNLRGNYGWTPTNKEVRNPNFASPSAVMMNMPFAKSYFLESSKQLRKEPSLYIENRIFDELNFKVMETWKRHEVVENETLGNYTLVRFGGESNSL